MPRRNKGKRYEHTKLQNILVNAPNTIESGLITPVSPIGDPYTENQTRSDDKDRLP